MAGTLTPKKRLPTKKLYGLETPRLFTAPLRELTPETSLGFSVIEFADEILKVNLLPWQRWLLIHALELLPDRSLRFRNVVVLVGRQNGKSEISKVLALWSVYIMGRRRVLTTAQDLDTAEEIWQGAVDLVEEVDEDDEPIRPDLATAMKAVVRVNGKKALVLKTGEQYKVKAANRRAGRGLTGDLIILDELREHQNWDAWAAITKTTQTKRHAQIWCYSNAGDSTSVVLRYLRLRAHEALGDPDGICAAERSAEPTAYDAELASEALADAPIDPDEDPADLDDVDTDDLEVDTDDLFLAEWSAEPGLSKWNRKGWAQSNPSLGYLIDEKTIAGQCKLDPEWTFRTEVLCQWPADKLTDGIFPTGSWESTTNELADGELAAEDQIVGDSVVCIDVSHDRSRAWVARAGYRADGQVQVEIATQRYGTAWVAGWLMERRTRIKSVTGQRSGAPVSALLQELAADPAFTIPIVEWGGADLIAGYGRAHDAVRDGIVRHNPQPALDAAAEHAVRKVLGGDGWVVDRAKSPGDASPLVAWIGAYWLLTRPKKASGPPPAAPAYLGADDGLLVGVGAGMNVMTARF